MKYQNISEMASEEINFSYPAFPFPFFLFELLFLWMSTNLFWMLTIEKIIRLHFKGWRY
jgi:hypothetical protein